MIRRRPQPPSVAGLGAQEMLTQELFEEMPLGGWHGEMADISRQAPPPAPEPFTIPPADWSSEVDGDLSSTDEARPDALVAIGWEAPPWRAEFPVAAAPPPPEPLPRFTPPEADWRQEEIDEKARARGERATPAATEEVPGAYPPPRRAPAA